MAPAIAITSYNSRGHWVGPFSVGWTTGVSVMTGHIIPSVLGIVKMFPERENG